MAELHGRRPSEWRRLFLIVNDVIDQLRKNAGGYDFEWSFGGGTAMMIQIGHRESMTSIFSSMTLNCSALSIRPRAN